MLIFGLVIASLKHDCGLERRARPVSRSKPTSGACSRLSSEISTRVSITTDRVRATLSSAT
jgi:hypothetical protein